MDGIGTAVKERAPELREAIGRFCQNIWEAILLFFGINSPSTKMMRVAGDLIAGLLKGLWDGLSRLIGEIGKWTGKIMSAIVKGIKEGWGQLKTLVNQTINKIKGYFDTGWSTFKGIGKDIIDGLIAGVTELWDTIKKKFEDLAKALPKWIKDILGIKSPSTIFKT